MHALRVGRLFGVEVDLDWSWVFILVLVAWNLTTTFSGWHPAWPAVESFAVALSASFLFFGCVLIHELAHALVARRYGLRVSRVTLLLLGGVTDIERQPSSARSEFFIALVGPSTSIVLGVGLLAAAVMTTALTPAEAEWTWVAQLGPLETQLVWLGPMNLVVGAFNLIPAFPLDGGRVLRSILWGISGDLRASTRWASVLGQAFGVAFIAVGAAMTFDVHVPFFGRGVVGGLWLAVVGWLLNATASQARGRVAVEEALRDRPFDRRRAAAGGHHVRMGAFLGVVGALTSAAAGDASRRSLDASPPLGHEWRLIEGKHWQVVLQSIEDRELTDAAEGTRGRCGAGMVEVAGSMMVDGWGYADVVDALQSSTCVDWIDRVFPERCARFDPERWSRISKNIPTRPMHFCIDRFEYPGQKGAAPWIMVNWSDAGAICAREGRRLCTEAEWTFACEGEGASPYPYGYERDHDACVVDRRWRAVDASALVPPDHEKARVELDKLWQGEASGARPRCRSAFGVYDMTGNVDEWTTSVVPGERPSVLKGGYWGPVRARCRASTQAHGEDFAFYQQGFRCCSDAP